VTLIFTASTHSAAHAANPLPLLILAAVGYMLHCIVWPFRSCRKCEGRGRFPSPSGRSWQYCSHCGGRGAQLRFGRRLWAYLKDAHDRDRRHRR
jgi:hypothetical protein